MKKCALCNTPAIAKGGKLMNYAEARNDAGYLREYLAREYGQVFVYGGSVSAWRSATVIAGRLARMIGWSRREVELQAAADYRDLED